MLRERLIVVAALSLVGGCTSPVTVPSEVKTAVPTSPDRAVIFKLQFRDVDLTVLSSSEGPRFALAAHDGTVLAQDLGDAELAKSYPDLYKFYRSAMAKAAHPYLDARLDSRWSAEDDATRVKQR
ncbi:MAG TPA: hypothetical protein VF881_02155 [Polyangiaceae bacterium]